VERLGDRDQLEAGACEAPRVQLGEQVTHFHLGGAVVEAEVRYWFHPPSSRDLSGHILYSVQKSLPSCHDARTDRPQGRTATPPEPYAGGDGGSRDRRPGGRGEPFHYTPARRPR